MDHNCDCWNVFLLCVMLGLRPINCFISIVVGNQSPDWCREPTRRKDVRCGVVEHCLGAVLGSIAFQGNLTSPRSSVCSDHGAGGSSGVFFHTRIIKKFQKFRFN